MLNRDKTETSICCLVRQLTLFWKGPVNVLIVIHIWVLMLLLFCLTVSPAAVTTPKSSILSPSLLSDLQGLSISPTASALQVCVRLTLCWCYNKALLNTLSWFICIKWLLNYIFILFGFILRWLYIIPLPCYHFPSSLLFVHLDIFYVLCFFRSAVL